MTDLIELDASMPSAGRARTLVLFVPGLGGHADQWTWIAPKLIAAGVDVGYVARLPTGRDDDGRRIGSVIEAGARLAEEVEALAYEDVHLVAHSVGSFLALEAMNARPGLFASAVLANGGLSTVGRFLERPFATLVSDVRVSLLAIYLFVLVGVPVPGPIRNLIVRHRWLASALLGRIIGKAALESEDVRRLLVSNGGHPDIFLALWRNRGEWSHFVEIAPSLDPGIRLLAGDADGLAGVADTEEVAGHLVDASTTVLPGVGHAASLEAPDEVLAEILRNVRDEG